MSDKIVLYIIFKKPLNVRYKHSGAFFKAICYPEKIIVFYFLCLNNHFMKSG